MTSLYHMKQIYSPELDAVYHRFTCLLVPFLIVLMGGVLPLRSEFEFPPDLMWESWWLLAICQ